MNELKNKQITKVSDYMKFIVEFYHTMLDNRITLAYEGRVTQEITNAFANMAEQNIEHSEKNNKLKHAVYHVMVECLQNIAKHADNSKETDSDSITNGLSKSGIFIVGSDQTQYFITSGNAIENSRIDDLRNMINQINSLDKSQLKELYKQKLREGSISKKGGAGLGLVDMARKTENKLEYHFEPIDNNNSFFLLKSTINKNK